MLNKQDKEMFKYLAKSEVGKAFIDYIGKVVADVTDTRQLKESFTIEDVKARKLFAEMVDKYILNYMVFNESNKNNTESYE